VNQDGFLQGMHPVNPTLRVRGVGTDTCPGRKAQCHPNGLFAQAIGGEVVVETEQCKSRNQMRH